MAATAKPAPRPDDTIELTVTRRFDAPPAEVFEAWTDPARIGRWIGPRGVSGEAKQMELRPGGAYAIAMHLPSGPIKTVRGIYREIRAPERLIFTWAWDGEDGKPGHETLVTITFRALGQGSGAATEMTFLHQRFAETAARDSHQNGWTGSFDKLAEFLAAK
jgi:uncharacterized protein YndB with AHSA1/START domain